MDRRDELEAVYRELADEMVKRLTRWEDARGARAYWDLLIAYARDRHPTLQASDIAPPWQRWLAEGHTEH